MMSVRLSCRQREASARPPGRPSGSVRRRAAARRDEGTRGSQQPARDQAKQLRACSWNLLHEAEDHATRLLERRLRVGGRAVVGGRLQVGERPVEDALDALAVDIGVLGERRQRAADDDAERHQHDDDEEKGQDHREPTWQPAAAALTVARAAAAEQVDERREQVLERKGEHERNENRLQIVHAPVNHGKRQDDQTRCANSLVKVQLTVR